MEEIRASAASGCTAVQETILRLCATVEELSLKLKTVEEDKVALEVKERINNTRLINLEDVTKRYKELLGEMEVLKTKVESQEAMLEQSRWVDVDLMSTNDFDLRGVYRVCIDDMNGSMKDAWIYPSRILPSYLLFDPASPAASSYYARIPASKKSRWEYFPKNSDSPSSPAIPIIGYVYAIQVAML
eukprot:TRINITY_DN28015_c0_g1_i1.p1 TRINITY_DN28015_c0_g1~~TRINITY_DN28015_c0_g1_i1.p1  ORF type:complete len:195 (+),score=68.04 TRINITY_DN28015_c0_g1_i1:25-585(+)